MARRVLPVSSAYRRKLGSLGPWTWPRDEEQAARLLLRALVLHDDPADVVHLELAEYCRAHEEAVYDGYHIRRSVRRKREFLRSSDAKFHLTQAQIVGPLLYTTEEAPYYRRGLVAE